ncbi:MAG: hypothetical protein AABY81_00615 [Pseudomonadota bacterium]
MRFPYLQLITILAVLLGYGSTFTVHAADKMKFETDPPQRLEVRYRLFKTGNMWNFLELDTQTGRLWQVQFSVDNDDNRTRTPINTEALVADGKNGRFTLYSTDNMWNFLMVDQDSGRVWQAQFSIDDENRGIFPIVGSEDTRLLPEKLLKNPR